MAIKDARGKLVRKKGGVTSGQTFQGIPFVPPGVYPDSELSVKNFDQAVASVGARKELEGFLPRLNDSVASGDIFAYNAAIQDLKSARAKRLGEELPVEMPDDVEIEKTARRRGMRRRNRGRQSTILTDTLGSPFTGLG